MLAISPYLNLVARSPPSHLPLDVARATPQGPQSRELLARAQFGEWSQPRAEMA